MKCSNNAKILQDFMKKDRTFDILVGLNVEFEKFGYNYYGKNRHSEVSSIVRAEESRRSLMLPTETAKESAMVSTKMAEDGTRPITPDMVTKLRTKKAEFTKL